jgi:hypothetical protein
VPDECAVDLEESLVDGRPPGRVENDLDHTHALVERFQKGSIDGLGAQMRHGAHHLAGSESRASGSKPDRVEPDGILKLIPGLWLLKPVSWFLILAPISQFLVSGS